jgi:streptogrisin C
MSSMRSVAHWRRVAVSVSAVVVVLVLAAPGGATAAPSDPPPSKEIVDAMVAQFGLTPSEARERIRAEAKASNIRDAARQAAGGAYAGAFFDPASLGLVVRVTDPAVFDAVRATGAVPQLTSTSYADLEQDLHVLDSRAQTQPPEVTGWRIDEPANTVVVDVVGGPTQGVKTFVAGLAHVRVDYDQPPVQTTADLIGGMAIVNSGSRCSLGFSARDSAGVVYVLTAGHCTNLGGTWSGSAGTIGTVAGSSFPATTTAGSSGQTRSGSPPRRSRAGRRCSAGRWRPWAPPCAARGARPGSGAASSRR